MHTTNDREAYVCNEPMTAREVLQKASEIIAQRYARQSEPFTSPTLTKEYLQLKLSNYDREVFGIMLLDSQHRLIEFQELFQGTINAAAVYPREIVKAVIQANAAAVILTHNHPSGIPEPSQADMRITEKIKSCLEVIDVPVLDHIVVGETCVSFAERGLL
ncbi:hypothetical protein CWE09_04545 [Aliidiomarina minuta]|uniref:MPN domain-containing protein n=1 Tax=Aliidiomarina minuta TaxID=880057 RepID=A0A432W7D9_9GAMM|nr:DNA repair protein RadC [Aliidiomarina minuta]RUO26000.1 hypothetical protein CWE09_04545 [Aliidiomarina minuta]